MIENVITSRIEVRGYENIKQIKDEILKLRTEMKDLTSGTEEYRKASDKLVQTEYDLKTAMTNAKNGNSALKGSYNDLVNQMNSLKKVWKETNDAALRANYGQQINELNNALKGLDATTGNYQRNVGDYANQLLLARQELSQLTEGTEEYGKVLEKINLLNNQIKEITTSAGGFKNQIKQLRAELSQLTKGSAEYNAKLRELANVTNEYREQQVLIKGGAQDLGTQLDNVTAIGSGLASGFGALNAALGLFGKETDEVQKAMLKVQQTMALVQGLKGMEGLWKKCEQLSTALGLVKATTVEENVVQAINNEQTKAGVALTGADSAAKLANAASTTKLTVATSLATKAQKAFNTAIKSNPIGLILSLVAGAIALFTAFGDKLDFLSSKEERIRKKEMKRANERAKEIEWEIKENEAKWDKEYKYTEAGYKKYQDYYDNLLTAYQDDADNYHQTAIDKMRYEKEYRQYQKQQAEQAREAFKKENEERMAEIQELRKQLKDIGDEWEKNAFESFATSDDSFVNGINETIDRWNDFIKNGLPKSMGGSSLFIPEKSEFGSKLRELVQLYDKDFFKPVLDRSEDGVILATKKNIDTVKKARKEIEHALVENILNRAYDQILNELSEQEQKLSHQLNETVETYRLNTRRLGSEIEDQIDLERDQYDLSSQYFKERIGYLENYLKEVGEIYGEDSEYYILWQEKVSDLQMQYNTKQLQNTNDYKERLSRLWKDALDRDNQIIRKDTKEDVEDVEAEYKKLASNLSRIKFDGSNGFGQGLKKMVSDYFSQQQLPKEYEATMEEVYRINKSSLEEIIGNLETALKDEEILGNERKQIEEELHDATRELEDLDLQHTLEVNELKKESYLRTVAAIKDSISATADIFGTWADSYKMLTDAEVNNSKTAINNQLKAGKITKEVAEQKLAAVDDNAEKEFETVKKLQAAQATINTLSAAISAYQSLASIPYVGPVLGAAAAAAALQYGYAQVQLIKSTSYGSSSSSNGSSSPTQVTPQIDDYSPNRVTNITGAMETENLANAMRNTPLWVSVQDINSVQNQVKVKDRETSF